ncbi:anoctamin-7-like isoform X2 [Tachypleus tridentatus]|uniref:anoctamin-7-like isoform X2 n=2 Tax=Tachypleus tridentatus TaxID=6853 RepID=UPI003FCF5665
MPYQVATLIARAKPGATIEPSRTRILRRGGILIQPATAADQIYLCQPWNTEFKCGTGGCLFELSLQLAIIVAGKQIINAVVEMGVPWLLRVYKKWSVHKKDQCAHENQWESDYNLINQEELGLFSEYLEKVLQFGFVTIFVVAFPLAPLFASLNNITEIRLDARKFITFLRRPVAERVKNIECTVWSMVQNS